MKRSATLGERGMIMLLTDNNEQLYRLDDQDVIDMEARVTIIESQEAIDRQLAA